MKDYLNKGGNSLVCARGPPTELLKSDPGNKQAGLEHIHSARQYGPIIA